MNKYKVVYYDYTFMDPRGTEVLEAEDYPSAWKQARENAKAIGRFVEPSYIEQITVNLRGK